MTRSIVDIPELTDCAADRGLIRIPMEQDVVFTSRVRAIVETAEFQRLATVTQLGLASCVYPGATHTRFEHALGVFDNAVRYLRQLSRDPRFCETVDAHLAEVLLAAALLHDLGHWPFCHPIEDMNLPGVHTHEEFAAEFLSPQRELSQVLKSEWGIEPDEVLRVLVGNDNSRPFQLVRSILSGPIDIDKMDYLDRDSLHAGVPYGRNFDKNRLIQSLLVNENGDGLAISAKGKTAAELMVFARYVMFSEVYWHHAVRAATTMFARAFFSLREQLDLRTFFQLSEADVIRTLRERAMKSDCEPLIEGIFGPKRRLYKRAGEYSLYQSPQIYSALARRPYSFLVQSAEQLANRIGAKIGESLSATDFLIDAPPLHREIEFKVDIFFAKERVFRPLQTVSPVIDALARTQFDDHVKRVRIFVHPRLSARIELLANFDDLLRTVIEPTA